MDDPARPTRRPGPRESNAEYRKRDRRDPRGPPERPARDHALLLRLTGRGGRLLAAALPLAAALRAVRPARAPGARRRGRDVLGRRVERALGRRDPPDAAAVRARVDLPVRP